MEQVVEELRAKLRIAGADAASRDLPEARLELACAWGSGHVLVTGPDREQVDGVLDRVIRKVDPMGTIRANAGDPSSTVDRLIALLDSEQEVTGHLDRRKALLQLLARAQEARKSIFVVVDDADAATVEQLERLRMALEVAPDAIERLRLVLVGDATLPAKLDVSGARALSSRITSRIRVGGIEDVAEASARSAKDSARASRASTWGFTAAAAMSFAVISYATVLLLSAPEIRYGGELAGLAPAHFSASETPARNKAWRPLTGEEAYLDSPLQIPADSRWVTGSALFAPPAVDAAAQTDAVAATPSAAEPPAETVVAAVPAPQIRATAKSSNPTRARAVSAIDSLASLVGERAKPATPAPAVAAERAKPATAVKAAVVAPVAKPTAGVVAKATKSAAPAAAVAAAKPTKPTTAAPPRNDLAAGSSIATLRSRFK